MSLGVPEVRQAKAKARVQVFSDGLEKAVNKYLKKIVPLVIAVGSLLIVQQARAGLDWTLDECKKHYGEPTNTEPETDDAGLPQYCFNAHDLTIWVSFDAQTRKAVCVLYIGSPEQMNNDFIAKLIAQWPQSSMEEGRQRKP
jgi:hypothetical protein